MNGGYILCNVMENNKLGLFSSLLGIKGESALSFYVCLNRF